MNREGKTPSTPEGVDGARGLGVTPRGERVRAKQVKTVTWLNVEAGVYRCIDCGAAMISLVERDESGHIVLREIPLLCPYCAALADWAGAAKRVIKEARTLSEARKLISQLFDFEIPTPYEGQSDE
jgi:hypothetical protein